jgi:hypothetical protein
MFWLFNNDLIFDFYQIFTDFNKNNINNSNNKIYNFNNNIKELDIDLDSYKMISVNFEIIIIDNLIKYTNIDNNNEITFKLHKKFIKSDIDNIKNLPIFNFKYIKVDNNLLPNINNSYYDNTYKFNFNIYYINDNLLLINEKNLINNNIKFYWLSTNLNNFSKLIFE